MQKLTLRVLMALSLVGGITMPAMANVDNGDGKIAPHEIKNNHVVEVPSLPDLKGQNRTTSSDVEVASMYIICWRNNYVEVGYAGCTTLY